MPYIDIQGTIPDLPPFPSYQVYNGLDCCMTAQIGSVLVPQMSNAQAQTYAREKRVQQLCMEISTKGFPVDQLALAELLWALEKDVKRIEDIFSKYLSAVGHLPINSNSPKQVAEFFYDYLSLPTIYSFDKTTKKRKISTDVKALEKLRTNYPIAAPFVNCILKLRETKKMISVFKRGLEPDTGNLRCNYTPSGTETGRLSSQQNPYWRGTNAQNLTDRVRQVIHAPSGYCFLNVDLKTAESIAVGFISGSIPYIEACLGKPLPDGTFTPADLHTTVASLVWRTLAWEENNLKHNRAIADQKFYRHFSYRDMSKRGGHGTNYYGTPRTMASHLKVGTALIQSFQDEYFRAFPEIPEWHTKVIATIQMESKLTTQLGRVRQFWGRPNDANTHREAIAYEPQSLIGDVMNEGLLQVLDWAKRNNAPIDLRAQVHDSGLFLIPINELEDLTKEIGREIIYPVDFGSLGEMRVPVDFEVGLTWCKRPRDLSKANRYEAVGMVEYSPGQELHF